ncbi:hypothetical protein [Archangium lipolyticum]|uniref:hypothetical protein n=1 Tax=Archangium lipolyticum TaxID=2970465 RepID=UPI002149BCB6|nr:hypothetical protein [Archangium lipolyticum]
MGVSLSAVGCGGTEVSSETEALASAEQAMDCRDCGGPGNEPEDPVDPPPPPPPCPSVLPEPADRWSIECKYKGGSLPRCAYAIPAEVCTSWQNNARFHNLVTDDGLAYLREAHLCPSVMDYGRWANDWHIASVCPEGCFEASTRIMSIGSEGQLLWMAAEALSVESVLASLSSEASLDAPLFNPRSIENMTKGPEEQSLYVFVLDQGQTLKVTQNHGMLLADGRMVKASDVTKKDSFVGVDGSHLKVKDILRETTSKDVYNFRVDSSEVSEHIIAAEGVLVGDLAWQGELSHELGSINLRK